VELAAYQPQKEWWWVVECSDYLRKQHPGTPRYAVIPISRLNQYRNIQCRVRYSTEAAANAAAIAAESGRESLLAWHIVWWPSSYRNEHPEKPRFEAVPENNIRDFWSLGAKTVWSGMSQPDAAREAARRSSLPEPWCVVPNEDARTNSQEPFTVKSYDGLSHSEKDNVRATCDSERAAWQAIPKLLEDDRQRSAAYEQQRREWAKTERRNESLRQAFRIAVMVGLIVVTVWLVVTFIRWFWVHPLF